MPHKKRVWRENEERLVAIYRGINYRCNNEKYVQYHNYGGRGIKCEWKTFEEFYQDMLPGYEPGLSIDRIKNNGNYNKENCRWLTVSQNSRKADKDYIPDGELFQLKARPYNPLDILFDNCGLHIKGYCGEEKLFLDRVTVIDGIEIHTYGAL